jgi:hypothetical protein
MQVRTRASVAKREECGKSAKALRACRRFLILVQVVVLQMRGSPDWLPSLALVCSENVAKSLKRKSFPRSGKHRFVAQKTRRSHALAE